MGRIATIGRLALVLLLAAGALVACGDDDDSPTVSGDDGTTTTEAAASGDTRADASIDMHEYAYTVKGDVRAGGTIHLENTGKEFHMLGMAKLKPGKTYDDAVAALKSETEDDDAATMDQIGMPGAFVGPGGAADVTVPDLAAGDYIFACFINVEGEETPHFLRGMTGQITVTDEKAPLPKADATYEVSKGKAVSGPATLSAGYHVIAVHRDASGDVLEPGIYRLDDGKTIEDFAKAVKVFDEGPLPKGAAALLPGDIVIGEFDFGPTETVYLGVDLEPGKYFIASDDTDVENPPELPVERIEITVS
jgi:hypothetical protein